MNMDPDTAIGGARGAFPATRHSAVVRIASGEPDERTRAWETIVAAYWKPVYKYVRLRWRQSNEDAKDTVQAFFMRAMEKDYFRSFDPKRASFRTFVRTCVDGFVANERKAATAQKRAPAAPLLSLDFANAEPEMATLNVADPNSLEEYFRREWVRSVFELAVDRVRTRVQERAFRAWELYDLTDEGSRRRYADIAEELGATVTQVTNWLAAARREFRLAVLDHLHELTASDREFEAEAHALLGTPVR